MLESFAIQGRNEWSRWPLRRRAARVAKSLNEVALEALALGAGVGQQAQEQHDLDFLIGSWVEDAAVDQALEGQRKVDEDLWR